MKTHIVLLKSSCPGPYSEYGVQLITEQWHIDCNNFKGSKEECEIEAKKQEDADRIFYAPQEYVQPHYPNAAEGSIHDY